MKAYFNTLWLAWLTCAVVAFAQDGTQRPLNTSLLIDLADSPPPTLLSQSGLFTDMAAHTVAPGILPYTVQSELWSDGAHKTRYLALPGDTRIDPGSGDRWALPDNTVLVKNFYLQFVLGDSSSQRIIETRFLVNGGPIRGWRGFTYQWNEQATEATLLPSGADVSYEIVDSAGDSATTVDYVFPAPEDCLSCHTFGSGQVLGLRAEQLSAGLLAEWNQLGVFTRDADVDGPRWARASDPAVPVEARARAYLAANCAHCHRPGGLRRTDIDLRYGTPVEQMGIVDRVSDVDDLDGVDRRLLKPGDPDNSVLLLRTLALGDSRMPPVASSVIDPSGTELLRQWIIDMGRPTVVEETDSTPDASQLYASYPNPFNAAATIPFHVGPQAQHVSLTVHDLLGQHLRTLVAKPLAAGTHHVVWDGRGDDGRPSASGVYLVRLVTGDTRQSRRVLQLK